MTYRLISELTQQFRYSAHSSALLKEHMADQLVKMLEMYNDTNEMLRICEMTDYEGNDVFWYLDEYDLYSILDCRILDRIIQRKWNGKFDLNAYVLDFSTSYVLATDKHGLFASDRVFIELKHEMTTLDRRDLIHGCKYEVWKYSMYLRAMVDLSFALFLTVFF